MTKPLRIIFAGTPDFAATGLAALLTSEHQIVAAYTQPDRPAGRGRKLSASPVKTMALEHNIPVYQPQSLKSPEAQAELAALNADIMVVIAYGLLLPKAVLETPKLGCINVHASLLPRWRGAAPIHRAVLAGDKKTGITIMQMDEGLDTGAMLYKTALPIAVDETSAELHDRLAVAGAETLIASLTLISKQEIEPEIQDDRLACYAHKLTKQEGQINWEDSAEQIQRQVLGLNSWPIAYTNFETERLRIWQASASSQTYQAEVGSIVEVSKNSIAIACGTGSLLLEKIQLPGGKPISITQLLNAKAEHFSLGKRLG